MAGQRLTDEQRDEAARRYDEARAMARRFKTPAGMTRDEWQAEVLLVLVQTVARHAGSDGFEALLYMATRWRWHDLLRRAQRRHSTLPAWDLLPAREVAEDSPLDAVLQGLEPVESDLVKLRLAGGDWHTLGRLYGCCGRTVRRRHHAIVEKMRQFSAVN